MPIDFSRSFPKTAARIYERFPKSLLNLRLTKDKFKFVSDHILKHSKRSFKTEEILFEIKEKVQSGAWVVSNTITTSNLKDFVDEQMFAVELRDAIKLVDIERKQNNRLSEYSSIVGRELVKLQHTTILLGVDARNGDYMDSDRELFSWFAVDDNPEYNKKNVFIKNFDGRYLPIYFNKTASGYRAEYDTQAFHDTYRERYKQWAIDAEQAYMTARDESKINDLEYSESEVLDIVNEVHKVLPKAIGRQCKLDCCFTPNKDGDYFFNAVRLKLNFTNGNDAVWEETNIADMMARIIWNLDRSQMQVIKRYTNNPAVPAILTLPLDYIQSLIEEDRSPLPDVWRRFLSNKFSVDKEAQLYRLAKFMVSVMDDKNYSRQMLCLADKGHSGKSTFINAIQYGLNRLSKNYLFARQVNNIALLKADKSQEGLEDVMDSRLIVATEVNNISEFVDAQNVKNITGGDTVIAGVKYGRPVYKNMAGTKIIICTNNWVNVKNTAVESRIIPIVFNEFTGDPEENLSHKLADTIEGFLAWCIWYSAKIEEKYSMQGIRSCRLFSSDHPEYERKEIFQNLTSEGQVMFRYRISDEYTELDENYMQALCETMNMESTTDESEPLDYSDLIKELRKANAKIGCTERTIEPFLNPRSKDYKALREFLKDKYGMKTKKSNGITKFYGIKLTVLPLDESCRVKKSYDGQAWANSDNKPPVKEHREGEVIDTLGEDFL